MNGLLSFPGKRWLPLATVGSLALTLPAVRASSRLAAQTDARLVAAVRLAQDGLSDSARAVAGRILAATLPTDSLYPEVLYTVGLLAATEQDRRLQLRRVVVDYGQSEWADDALLQLAQLDYAGGNTESTIQGIDQLLRDYPASPLTALAAFWGARAANDRRDPPTACRMADLGIATASDVELKNQLEFQQRRCQGLAAVAADSVARATADSIAKARPKAPNRPPAAPPRRQPGFYVQVSAVLSSAAAVAETARVKRAGYTSVTVKEGGYLKIRAGVFRTRAEADKAAQEIKARLGGSPFVVRVP